LFADREDAMRRILSVAVLGLACSVPAASNAQGTPPPGSYQQQCRNISMDGMYLHAWCRGSRGSGESTLNVRSCGTDIGVDPDGGLICGGPGGGQPNYPSSDDRRPYPDDGRRPAYPDDGRRPAYPDNQYRPNDDRYRQNDGRYDDRYRPNDDRYRPNDDRYDDRYRPYPNGRGPTATLYEGPGFRGRSIEVYGETPNLADTRFNDRVGSIRFGRRSGPWQICADSRFRGRCVVVRDDLRDANEIGMGSAISSLRPAR
jgi:hypothetical protein